ncbi:MFS transporter [Auraticoccus monumenti]|uniref:Fucose permease n=1 Tax=Auraticoccus monumenti TaxID=675864 RepID=A0A1G6S5P8_9ACTN|nr:MFS transporter [Auraticoccus monumenti]SDD12188.1 Fucose permease [Auraticoccus monumenti]
MPSLRPTPRRARLGVSLMFFTNGVLLAALLPRYPEIKSALDLSGTGFGTTVVAFPLGAILTASLAGKVIRALGARRVTAVGSVLLAASTWLAGTSGSTWAFFAALLVAGALDAVVDAAQNVHGVAVERWGRRSMINSFHALWSLGAACGGAVGAWAAASDVAIGTQMLVNGTVWSVVAVLASVLAGVPDAQTRPTLAGEEVPGDRPRARAWRLLLPLVLLAICGTLVEDIANNWTVLFLQTETSAPEVVAGLGLTVVLAAQFVGRLVGDPMTDRWGRASVARAGGVLIALGMLVVVLPVPHPLTLVGLALTGFGSATLVPAAFAAADRVPGLPAGTGIALLGWLMRLGFLVTSPVVGVVSDAVDLRAAMLLPLVAGVVAAVLAHRVRTSGAALEGPAADPGPAPGGSSTAGEAGAVTTQEER